MSGLRIAEDPAPKMPTGVDLIVRWHGPHGERARTCPGCTTDCSHNGITALAYVFDICACGTPDYDHLVEQLWHRACLQRAPVQIVRHPPEGCHYEWRPDPEWRLLPPERADRRCRYMAGRKACGAPAVVDLNRRHGSERSCWWAYCAEHMFGREIRDGVVQHEVPVEDGAP